MRKNIKNEQKVDIAMSASFDLPLKLHFPRNKFDYVDAMQCLHIE
jgi:hypothetical protein